MVQYVFCALESVARFVWTVLCALVSDVCAWTMDELAAWKHPEAYDYHIMGLRLGQHPRQVITTTPRPTKIIRDLLKDKTTVVSRGSTYDNRDNLPDAFFNLITKRYEGTRMGRQELYAELLDDLPGALWTRDRFRYGEPRSQQGYYMIEVIMLFVTLDMWCRWRLSHCSPRLGNS